MSTLAWPGTMQHCVHGGENKSAAKAVLKKKKYNIYVWD